MRGNGDDAADRRGKRRREDQCNRCAIAVTEEPGSIGGADAKMREELRQHFRRLLVHERRRPMLIVRARRRASVALARKYGPAITAFVAELLRVVPPQPDRAQAFMQEYHQRRIRRRSCRWREPKVLDRNSAAAVRDVDER